MEQDQNVKRSYLHYITSNWKELRATSQPPPHEEEDDPRRNSGADPLIGKTFNISFVFGGDFCVCDVTVDSESGDEYLLTFEKDGVEEEYLMDKERYVSLPRRTLLPSHSPLLTRRTKVASCFTIWLKTASKHVAFKRTIEWGPNSSKQ